MSLLSIIIFSLVQAITEFLPVSSTAHLILLPKILNIQDPGLTFTVVMHSGSLIALMFYLRKNLFAIVHDITLFWKNGATDNTRLGFFIALTTIPICLAGFYLHDLIIALRSTKVIAICSLGFGILLGYAALRRKETIQENSLTFTQVMVIAFLQIFSLVPGVSRSGITMTGGLLVGLKRNAAARYSFLIGVPVIISAFLLETYKLAQEVPYIWSQELLLAFCFTLISSYLFINMFMYLLQKIGLMPFVVYRLLLSTALLFV